MGVPPPRVSTPMVLSLLAKIDENKKLLEQNSPSSGQKGNVADNSGKKECRNGRPGVARELRSNPDVIGNIFAERCDAVHRPTLDERSDTCRVPAAPSHVAAKVGSSGTWSHE
jgi:hypothetical protein